MYDYKDLFSLDEKRAVVVGAGAGIGEATAESFAAFGADVVCADRDLAAAQATADTIRRAGYSASAFQLDVTSADDCERAVRDLEPADVLVVAPGLNIRKPLLETTDEDFQRVFEVNLLGTYRLVRDFGRGMGERGGGSIIAFSSFRAVTVEVGQGLYAACKAGTVQLVRALADELGEAGVRVNAVAPGTVETPLTAQIKSDPAWYEAYRNKSILRRWAQPHEMVGALLYLASDASSYTTGSLMMLDGGWTAADGRFRPTL
jgi:NAD(P)-dependent dehydrogenase (short-subunit alcohol dehydrogenase family)